MLSGAVILGPDESVDVGLGRHVEAWLSLRCHLVPEQLEQTQHELGAADDIGIDPAGPKTPIETEWHLQLVAKGAQLIRRDPDRSVVTDRVVDLELGGKWVPSDVRQIEDFALHRRRQLTRRRKDGATNLPNRFSSGEHDDLGDI